MTPEHDDQGRERLSPRMGDTSTPGDRELGGQKPAGVPGSPLPAAGAIPGAGAGTGPDGATSPDDLQLMRKLSPRRKTSAAQNLDELVDEQLQHFGLDPQSEFGLSLGRISRRLYENQCDLETLWRTTLRAINQLDRGQRIACFNAKKFLCFQLAKQMDMLQSPHRRSYQSLGYGRATQTTKGPYAVFDNITAIFSANPVIARTATYTYACAEWIEEAFQGKELLLEIYSRLLNPTSIALANHIVDLEAGPYAHEYLAWNFNSGMAAIDTVLAHLLGRDDILITSRNIYGGTHQLIHDWYGKAANLEIAVESFHGFTAREFLACWEKVRSHYASRFAAGRKAYVFLESPCNPHGYVLDVPGICKAAHQLGLRVILDSTIATPFLYRPLQRVEPAERPDFVVHSYTKDLSGTGTVIAGVVIGRNEDMFLPKGQSAGQASWDQTLFWNVYYVKGAFLNADAAFDVLQGMHTLDARMLAKCINTEILARFLAWHPRFEVHCNVLPGNENFTIREQQMFLGLPAPLFTAEIKGLPRAVFERFFDSLAPTFAHMISLGQNNTIISCPALSTHSELDEKALAAAGISPTMIRFAMGHEQPRDLIQHLVAAAQLTIDPEVPGFSKQFPPPEAADCLIRECYLEAHRRYLESQLQTHGG